MKRHRSRVWFNFAAALAIAALALTTNSIKMAAQQTAESPGAAVPTVIPFSGVLRDGNGKPLSGMVGVTFLLYKEQQQESAPLWLETQNVQPDKAGRYSVTLGSTSNTGLPNDIFTAAEARWLGVQIAGQAEQPRVMLVSVPYALKAGDAATIGGLPASAFVRANGTATAQAGGVGDSPMSGTPKTVKTSSPYGTNGYLPFWTSASTVQNSNLFQSGTGNMGIGTASPGATLDVNGTGNFRGLVTFAAGQTFPGTGTVTGVTAGSDLLGGGNGGNVTLNLDTTKVPLLAAANTFTGNQIVNGNLSATGVVTGSGYQIGSNLFDWGSATTGDALLGFAGNPSISGSYDTAAGWQALFSNTTGGYNTAVGTMALYTNSIGGANTASGLKSLYANTTGSQNTASGVTSMYNNTVGGGNTAVGHSSLYTNTSGSFNTAIGRLALPLTTTGNGNTATGYAAGEPLDGSAMTGSNNTFLGLFSGPSTGTLSNASAIGADAAVSESNAMVLGSINGVNLATADTNVGIGTTSPQTLFHVDHKVSGGGMDVAEISSGGSTDVASLIVQNTSGGGLRLRVGAGTGSGYIASSGTLALIAGDSGSPSFPNGPVMTMDSSGNVHIPGNLSKGGGSFQIDHPLDPANKYLYHSFVESPDMMNIYNGVVHLDARGSAWITLPSYFEALNRDFRYQLTSLGKPQPSLYISREIAGNRFKISGGKAGGRVSWQVTGIRHDAYADAHRIPVETEKPSQEQGHYLHPELFGAPKELAIGSLPSGKAAGQRSAVASLVAERKR